MNVPTCLPPRPFWTVTPISSYPPLLIDITCLTQLSPVFLRNKPSLFFVLVISRRSNSPFSCLFPSDCLPSFSSVSLSYFGAVLLVTKTSPNQPFQSSSRGLLGANSWHPTQKLLTATSHDFTAEHCTCRSRAAHVTPLRASDWLIRCTWQVCLAPIGCAPTFSLHCFLERPSTGYRNVHLHLPSFAFKLPFWPPDPLLYPYQLLDTLHFIPWYYVKEPTNPVRVFSFFFSTVVTALLLLFLLATYRTSYHLYRPWSDPLQLIAVTSTPCTGNW